ncbi:MAG: DMT family transporter [Candidatus Cloacimonetes bacterium]|nr:DMT family transporter [Candidatus Cloacimonadota bacterium]
MKKHLVQYGIAVLGMLIFGLSFVWVKEAFVAYRPLAVVFVRLVLVGVLLDVLARLRGQNQRILPGDRKWFALLAFFDPFMLFLGESHGMNLVSPTLGSVVICTIPLVTPAFAWLFVKERITRWGVLGLVVSFVGILATVWDEGIGGGSLTGVGLLFIAVLAVVGYSLLVKTLAGRYSPLFIVKTICQLAVLYFLPLFLIFELKPMLATPPHAGAILAILKLTVLVSGLAYVCLAATIRNLGINNTNLFTFLIPVAATIYSHFRLGTGIGPGTVVGILLVGGGIAVSQAPLMRRGWRQRRGAQPPGMM